MTPMAGRLAKELMLPLKNRTFGSPNEIDRLTRDIHCFELSEVFYAAVEMARDVEKLIGGEQTLFLPAPKTWLEYHHPSNGPGSRTAWLLEETGEKTILATPILDVRQLGYREWDVSEPLAMDLERGVVGDGQGWGEGWNLDAFSPQNLIPVFLAFINTPRIIGRQQHMPHRGLERRLLQHRRKIGHFPLNAWTEIKLRVSQPKDMSGDASEEAHLTGQRALHFCRSHLRIRLGKLEIVRSHWRGDASLGVKQSRYVVTH